MSSKRNPDSSPVLQVLIDIADSGYGTMRVDQLITKLTNDAPVRKALDAKWHAHQYPSKKLVFTQISIEQRLMGLSDTALKVLVFFGLYCGQSGLIKVSKAVISEATGIKRTNTASAIRELVQCGAIAVHTKPVRHEASIYAVNPRLFKKGRRMARDDAEYWQLLDISEEDYLLSRTPEHTIKAETITDGYTSYQHVTIEHQAGTTETGEA